MTNTLAAPQVTATLSRLFAAAAQDGDASALLPGGAFANASALEKADAAQDVYMPISPKPATSSMRWSGPAARKPSWSSARRSASPPSTSPPR